MGLNVVVMCGVPFIFGVVHSVFSKEIKDIVVLKVLALINFIGSGTHRG